MCVGKLEAVICILVCVVLAVEVREQHGTTKLVANSCYLCPWRLPRPALNAAIRNVCAEANELSKLALAAAP
ncbi:jg7999 [Pararge aegeria aegeria]|uniref:Jg7999 protein n=1 Tax=Pararge aegeria aegeria TaxID=348720 RepID=A0A8S4RGN4_9NEOP|nr:jg7999 [Pararge aegeria aegeria]